MGIRESRTTFWAMMLVGRRSWRGAWRSSLRTYSTSSTASRGYVVLGVLSLAIGAGVATRRSLLETAAGAVGSIVAFGVLFVVLFFLLVPEDIFR